MTHETGAGEPTGAELEIAEYAIASEPPRDAVGEEDNPIPLWFNVGFYGMIAVGVVYLLYYTQSGWSQVAQYEAESAAFDATYERAAVSVLAANPFRGDEAGLEAGAEVFATICAACHKPDGTGLVGPSLVDAYWKYGSSDAELFEGVAKGLPGGMPPWESQLGADKIWQALAYLETLPRQAGLGLGAPGPGGP